DALGYGDDRHPHDGGTRRPALERDAQAAEERLRIARRGGEVEHALVTAAVVEGEDEADPCTADAVEPEAGGGTRAEPAQPEEQGLPHVEGVLEGGRPLHVARRRRRGERPLVLAACRAGERDTGGAEADRDLGDWQAREIAEPVHPPACE